MARQGKAKLGTPFEKCGRCEKEIHQLWEEVGNISGKRGAGEQGGQQNRPPRKAEEGLGTVPVEGKAEQHGNQRNHANPLFSEGNGRWEGQSRGRRDSLQFPYGFFKDYSFIMAYGLQLLYWLRVIVTGHGFFPHVFLSFFPFHSPVGLCLSIRSLRYLNFKRLRCAARS